MTTSELNFQNPWRDEPPEWWDEFHDELVCLMLCMPSFWVLIALPTLACLAALGLAGVGIYFLATSAPTVGWEVGECTAMSEALIEECYSLSTGKRGVRYQPCLDVGYLVETASGSANKTVRLVSYTAGLVRGFGRPCRAGATRRTRAGVSPSGIPPPRLRVASASRWPVSSCCLRWRTFGTGE